MVKNPPAVQETRVGSLGREVPLKKGMTAHFRILAWRTPRVEEPGGYGSWGHKESAMREWLPLFPSLTVRWPLLTPTHAAEASCIGNKQLPRVLSTPGGLRCKDRAGGGVGVCASTRADISKPSSLPHPACTGHSAGEGASWAADPATPCTAETPGAVPWAAVGPGCGHLLQPATT